MLPLFGFTQHTLTVKITDLKSSKGLIALGVYNSSETWLEDGKMFTGVFAEVEEGDTLIKLKDLPSGTYAVSLFHDENGDRELDKNIFGIPKEDLGFSKGKLKTFGPPSFEECSFEMTSDVEIKIPPK